MTLEDVERYDIFILHPASLTGASKDKSKGKQKQKHAVHDDADTGELFPSKNVREAFMKAIGAVLVDEGDFRTVLTRRVSRASLPLSPASPGLPPGYPLPPLCAC